MAEPGTTPPVNVPGNHYDKYHTGNPIARRLMAGFLEAFRASVSASGASSAYEVGCGEGELSILMARSGLAVRGSDIEASIIDVARSRAAAADVKCNFTVADLHTIDPAAIDEELVVCCEVLEHLVDPDAALQTLASTGARHFVFSVPREPLWRVLNVVRGRYLRDAGNTPGHLQHWSSAAFESLVSRHFDIVDSRRPLPWSMVLCRARRNGR